MPMTQKILNIGLLALAFLLPVSIAGTNIALGLISAALVAHLASGRPLAWREAWTPVAWCLCIYLAVSLLTSFTGVRPSRSLHNYHKDFHKFWVYIILMLALRTAAERRLPATMAAGFVFISTCGITLSCIESYHHVQALGFTKGWQRVHAYFNAVTFAEMLALGLLGGLVCLAQRQATGRSSGRPPIIAFIALLAAALILSQTRGATLGMLAGFAAMCAVEPALRRWIKWGLAAAALGLCIISFRNFRTASGENLQFTRLYLWDVAWRIFKDHPWLGVGPSNYATVYTDYCHRIIEEHAVWSSAHNIYLQQLAERGLVGLAALLALIWAFLARAWKAACRVPDAANLLALSATIAFIVMNMTESAFHNEQITTLFLAIWAYTQCRDLGAEADGSQQAGALT
jgi:O-antigen ligase